MKQKAITRFTSENLKDMRVVIQTALDKIAADFGLESIRMGNIKYDGGQFKAPLEAKLKMEDSPERQEQGLLFSQALGYNKNVIGLTFTAHNGMKYKVTNINLNRPKYPIEATNLTDNRSYKLTHRTGLKFDDKEVTYESGRNICATY